MRSVVLFSALLFSVSLFADASFDEHKKNFTDHLGNYSSVIQKANDCAKAATDGKALKACREAFHKELKEMKEKRKAERATKIDEKIKKLEQKKEELKSEKKTEKK